MGNYIRILSLQDKSEYENLLKLSYGNATGFVATTAAMAWGELGDETIKLGVFRDSQLISTMRMDVISRLPILNYSLQTNYRTEPFSFPIGCLTKGATHPSLQRSGFNAIMRYHFLKIAKERGVRTMVGTMLMGSPRILSMEQMGYSFQKSPGHWSGHYISEGQPLIASLDLEKFYERALGYIEKNWESLLIDFPFRGGG
jgi:hypothetical protein